MDKMLKPSDASKDGGEVPNIKSLLKLKKKYEPPPMENLPESFRKNSEKENLWLMCADNFLKQLRFSHPKCKPMLLTAKNECKVEKLICTFVAPTVIAYSDLAEVEKCAKFIADFIYYTPNKAIEGPLSSGMRVLQEQAGNSLEMSLLLVSLLRGLGYKVYVVLGLVDRKTAEMDLSGVRYTFDEKVEEKDSKVTFAQESKYKLKMPPDLKSKYQEFLLEQEELSKSKSLTTSSLATKGPQPMFIEATTGYTKSLTDPSYISINCLFNDQNYWLNIKQRELVRTGKTLMLDDTTTWVKLIQDKKPKPQPKIIPSATKRKQQQEEYRKTPFGLIKTSRQTDDDDKIEPDVIRRPWDTMDSWIGSLGIPKESYELIFRLGQKIERYFETKVEHFAPYLLKDGLVIRITKFRSNHEKADKIREVARYRNRFDKLEERQTYFRENRVVEHFGRGREDKLAQIVTDTKYNEEQVKTYTFYHDNRQDGLFQREVTEWELKDKYLDREDNLASLRVHFGVPDKKFGPAEEEENSRIPRKILKLIEEFNVPPGEEPSKNIAQRIYDMEEDCIKLTFHREKDRILSRTITFHKPPEGQKKIGLDDIQVYMVDPRQTPPTLNYLRKLYTEQLKDQMTAASRAKETEKQVQQRLQEEAKTILSVGLFDTKRNQRVQSGRDRQQRERKEREKSEVDLELDFLAPFLAKYPTDLTYQQALSVREECLISIKAGMKEKELELQGNLDGLKKEMIALKLKSDEDPTLQEEVQTKKFFISVVETRVKRHIQYAADMVIKVEKKIRTDPRLVILNEHHASDD